jgi:hypothetical protein
MNRMKTTLLSGHRQQTADCITGCQRPADHGRWLSRVLMPAIRVMALPVRPCRAGSVILFGKLAVGLPQAYRHDNLQPDKVPR